MIGARPALASVLVGAVGALVTALAVVVPFTAPAPTVPTVPTAAPVAAVAAPIATAPRTPTARAVTAAPRSTTQTSPKADPEEPSAAECIRIALRSSLPNVELRPHLRSIGCDEAADGLLVGAGDEESVDTSSSTDGSGSRDRDGNGVVNGYERCGTSCGEEPTSGELQYRDGCEQGYVPASEC